MSKLFYDHLTIREEITADLDLHDMDEETRKELIELVDEILSHHTLNVILSHLPKDHHSDFISKFMKNPNDKGLFVFLKEKINLDIEGEIKKHISKIKAEIKTEIKKSKTHH